MRAALRNGAAHDTVDPYHDKAVQATSNCPNMVYVSLVHLPEPAKGSKHFRSRRPLRELAKASVILIVAGGGINFGFSTNKYLAGGFRVSRELLSGWLKGIQGHEGTWKAAWKCEN